MTPSPKLSRSQSPVALIPQPLLPVLGEGEQEVLQSPSPNLGEGFRVRAGS